MPEISSALPTPQGAGLTFLPTRPRVHRRQDRRPLATRPKTPPPPTPPPVHHQPLRSLTGAAGGTGIGLTSFPTRKDDAVGAGALLATAPGAPGLSPPSVVTVA
jgi:hypothetical protein